MMHLTIPASGMTVAGTAVVLPKTRQRANEVTGIPLSAEDTQRAGSEELPVADGCAGPELAVQAGKNALDKAKTDPMTVHLLAHA
jgi:hypothetical protein